MYLIFFMCRKRYLHSSFGAKIDVTKIHNYIRPAKKNSNETNE